MKRRIWIAIAVIVIIAAVAVACIFGYVSGQKGQEPEPPATVEPDGNPAETEDPENPDDTEEPAVQPENPNPSGGESVVVYVPDEQGETLTPVGTDAEDDSDQALVDALITEIGRAV